MYEALKKEMVGSCPHCEGKGYIEADICSCLLKFRAYTWMTKGGFSRPIIDFVTDSNYRIPEMDYGGLGVSYFLDHPSVVNDMGLSLFIYSRESGRGKTTLAYHLVYTLCQYLLNTVNYKSGFTVGFQNVKTLIENDRRNQEKLWDASIYVLDDLGSEDRSAAWKIDSVVPLLQQVLHHRQDRRMPTIITSNLDPMGISALYNNSLDSLLELQLDGTMGGQLYRAVQAGGQEDLRLVSMSTNWPEDL